MMNDIKKINFKEPMVLLLTALLVFMCGGTLFAGCAKKADRIRVELDAAFGGDATGYVGFATESEVTEAITDRLFDLLSQDERFEVLRTHEAGQAASVTSKAEKVKKDDPALLISIHTGGVPDKSVSGMNIYPDKPGTSENAASIKAAEAIADAFTTETWVPKVRYLYYKPFNDDAYTIETAEVSDTSDPGLETWSILEKTSVPAVVVEQFYVTNEKDTADWANEESYDKAAMQYYHAVCTLNGLEPKDIQIRKDEDKK